MTGHQEMPGQGTTGISRRGLFQAAGVGALAVAGLGLGGQSAQAADLGVLPSDRFDLTQPSYDLFRNMRLHDATVLQGFTFDNVNRRLFTSQVRSGAVANSGDMCITQLDFDGNELGYMYLLGFGHGVSIGVEAVGSSSYLWTETNADSGGYGKDLARFKFVSGTTISSTSSGVSVFHPVAAAVQHTCAVDPLNNNLIVRYDLPGDVKRVAVYNLTEAASNVWTAAVDFAQPDLGTISSTFQGYTAYGEYLYCLTGTSYDDSPTLNSQVTSVNMNTGLIAQGPVITKAGSTLAYREPEGMAIYQTEAGETRLFLGMASSETSPRLANIFYKNVLV